MNDNSRHILNDLIERRRQELTPELSKQEYFEVFSAEQILKNFELSYDDLQSGIVDGEHDGGIDSAYAFVNGNLIREDFDSEDYKSNVNIELHLIQSKTSGHFSETPVNRFISATRHLLDLGADYSKLSQYNESVKAILDHFRKTYRDLASRLIPHLKIRYYYVSKNAGADIHTNLEKKRQELIEAAQELFHDAEIAMEFLGARHLLDLARTKAETTHMLKFSKILHDADAYLVLTPLSSYADFIKGSGGQIREGLFDSNVRDFQGSTEVNEDIAMTLKSEKDVDFWWMNNGITILASKATFSGDFVTITNPQVVNGLQTSKQIAGHNSLDSKDGRSVMVKILSSEDDETRDKIIKATNSQNPVQPASLRATDRIQRDIEDALKTVELYYDRRKNFYKSRDKPRNRIIPIPLMAQAIMSVILARPDEARARPSSLIKKDHDYSQIFSEDFPVPLYINAAVLLRRTQAVLRVKSEMTRSDRTNLRFYVLYWLIASATKRVKPTPAQVAGLKVHQITDDDIEAAIDGMWPLFKAHGGDDGAAKGSALIKSVHQAIHASFASSAPHTQL